MLPESSRFSRFYMAAMGCCVAAMSILAAHPDTWPFFVAASLLASILCVLVWRRGDVGYAWVIGLAIVFRLAILWLPPSLSDDPFRYVWDGLLQAHGVNPYLHPPESDALGRFHNEPVYAELNSAPYYSVYPPFSQLLFRFGALFYGGGWEASYYAIKAVVAAFEVGAVLLLARLVSAPALVLYAWNPLVLIAGAGQGHGEAALAFFLVAAWYLADRRKGGLASVCLACAGWIKLYPFFLFPFLWRRFGWKAVWPGLAATIVLAVPFVDPAVPRNVLQSLDLYVRLFEFNAGPYYLLKEIFLIATGDDWSKQLGPFLRSLFLASLPVLYYLDWRRGWPLNRAFLTTLGSLLLLSTTVHPWYIVPVLLLAVVRPSWHWYWLGGFSIGTYLLYIDGPYWVWVNVGWVGFAVLALWGRRVEVVDRMLRLRARGKAQLIRPYFPRSPLPVRLLDLGAGEGFVAEELEKSRRAVVQLADVVDLNRTTLPHVTLKGRRLPFADDEFDATVLSYVLHHAEDPEFLLTEAARVTRSRIIVLESTYRGRLGRSILEHVDRAVNRVRAGGRIDAMEAHLDFRTIDGWRTAFRKLGFREVEARDLGGIVHRRAVFVLEKQRQEV